MKVGSVTGGSLNYLLLLFATLHVFWTSHRSFNVSHRAMPARLKEGSLFQALGQRLN
jgi:hypothetical protein